MQLREIQKQFAREILHEVPATPLQTTILQRGIEAKRRLQIYKNNIHSTLTESLESVYSVTHAIVGDEFFKFMARNYIRKYSPLSGDLHRYGDRMPSFVDEMEELGEFKYLGAIARIDWACHRSFHEAEQNIIPVDYLNRFKTEEHEHLLLQLHPSVRIVSSPFPIFDIWNFAMDDDGSVPDIGPRRQSVLIVCRDREIKVIRIEDELHDFIEQILQVKTLGVIIPRILEANPEYNLQRGLHKLFALGTIVGVTVHIH